MFADYREKMKTSEIIIFTDGASKGNPGPGGWGAVVVDGAVARAGVAGAGAGAGENAFLEGRVVEDKGARVVELGGGEKNTTNNRMEMTAVIEALTYVFNNFRIKDQKIIVYLDSSYVLNGSTKWIRGWQENGWMTKGKLEVQNRDLWEKMAGLLARKESDNVEWKLLSGHVGIAGNERADEIATDFASGSTPELFHGFLSEYKIDILNISHDADKKVAKKKSSSRSKVPAYSYISMVKGIIKTHATWAECEARVKGVSGTRFKKATSAEEEKEIIAEWGG